MKSLLPILLLLSIGKGYSQKFIDANDLYAKSVKPDSIQTANHFTVSDRAIKDNANAITTINQNWTGITDTSYLGLSSANNLFVRINDVSNYVIAKLPPPIQPDLKPIYANLAYLNVEMDSVVNVALVNKNNEIATLGASMVALNSRLITTNDALVAVNTNINRRMDSVILAFNRLNTATYIATRTQSLRLDSEIVAQRIINANFTRRIDSIIIHGGASNFQMKQDLGKQWENEGYYDMKNMDKCENCILNDSVIADKPKPIQ